MKKTLTLSILFLISATIQAQKVPYEKLEELSTAISKLQFEANEKTYTDGASYYEVSFPESNFQADFSDQLATKVFYKKGAIQEILLLTEKIDFVKATEVKNMALGGLAGILRVHFPKEYLKTSIYENGKLLNTINESYIDFFYDKNNYKESLKLRSLINEMIALLKEANKQPYAQWLNQAIQYNRYDNEKREAHLQKLINNGDSEAMRLKGLDYFYKEKNNDKAMEWCKKSYSKGNIDALYNIGFLNSVAFSRLEEGERLINQAANLGSGLASVHIADAYSRAYNYTMSAQYYKKAIDAGILYDWERAGAYTGLSYSYDQLKDYSKMATILTDESFISSGIREVDFIDHTYYLLTGNGSCNEAVAYFTQMAEGTNTNDVKALIYEKLSYLYYIGCDGTKGNKVKKNKKLGAEYEAKSKSFKQ